MHAQNKYTISGKITDNETGEDLIGVTVYTADQTNGTITNPYGFFSLTLPQGQHIIKFSYVGYDTQQQTIQLDKDQTINVSLLPSRKSLNEVVVKAEKADQNLTTTQMGMEKLDMKTVGKLPVLFGEKDLLKTIQLMPGISTVSEGGSGFSVRGGSIGQNLILLDEAPVYSASHLLGFFSVFNADAINNMEVYKGGVPANYGGRASSVLDISMKDGNMKELSASGGIGLISSRLTLEGPIAKDKASFIVSGRRSYADLMAKGVGALKSSASLYFYDLNAKVNYKMNQNNRIYLSGYFGKDDFGFDDLGMDWGNTTFTARWNHIFSPKLFCNSTFIYSRYKYSFNIDSDKRLSSGIDDLSLKQDYTWYLNPDNTIKLGWDVTKHEFNPGEFIFDETTIDDIVVPKKRALESGLYIQNKQKINNRINVDYGVRLSMLNQLGEGDVKQYDEKNNITETVHYKSGEIIKTYASIEPRLALNYRLHSKSSLKLSYNRMAQYLHMLSNSVGGQPTDTWMPSTPLVKPTQVDQYSLGFFRNFDDNNWEFSIESYYKQMKNISDYEDGTEIMLNEDIEAYILQGKGRSYGAEFYLKKKHGKFTGWLSYTLAKTENKIDGINYGKWYNSSYDKRHDVSLVTSYQISKRVSLSANWVYYTGNATTFPSGKYKVGDETYPYYTKRNEYRMPDYHRLDLSLHLESKNKKRVKSSWDFSLYNVYNQMNAYSISFKESETVPGKTIAEQVSLFGIIPSVTWNFKF